MIEAVSRNTPAFMEEAKRKGTRAASGVDFSDVMKKTAGVKEPEESVSLEEIFEKASKKHGVPLKLLKAVAMQESTFTVDAVSRSGAQGLMQLMPATARELGVADSFDPEQNVMGGAKYLSQMLKKYDGDTRLALAAYNAGSNNVAKYGGIPPFKETQDYVVKVTKYMQEDISIPDKRVKTNGGSRIGMEKLSEKEEGMETRNPLPAAINTDAMKESEKEGYFSYEDYTRFINLWREQLQLFRMESNMTKIQSLFEKEENKERVF